MTSQAGKRDNVARQRVTGEAARALLERLGARDAVVRKEAVRQAGDEQVRLVAPRLVELLRDRNVGVAATAAWALGRMRYTPAEEPLARLLRAPNATLARGAAWAMGRLGTSDALDALLTALADGGLAPAHAVELALEQWPAATVAPRLVALLRQPDGPARARASHALLRRPGAAVIAVRAALEEGGTEFAAADTRSEARTEGGAELARFRRAAAYVLAEAAEPASLAALLDLSHVVDSRTRLYATRGLGALVATALEAAPRLRALCDDERRDVAAAARAALSGLEAHPEGEADAAPDTESPLELPPGQSYLLTVLPGLEDIAAIEVASLQGAHVTRRFTGALLARLDAPPTSLLSLRTVLDALLFAGYLPPAATTGPVFRDLRPARRALTALAKTRTDLPRTFYVHMPRDRPAEEARRLRAETAAILERVGGTITPAGAALHADVVIAGDDALLGLRVLRQPPGQRPLVAGALPASLNATLAAALVWLTSPAPDEVFLDPLCGAGTLLRERALAGSYARLLGGDRDERAVTLARANLAQLPNLALQQWDATALPLADGSVDKAALNPPYGRRAGSHAANATLYPALLAELARVVRPGGLVALVTTEKRLTLATLRALGTFARELELPLQVGGLHPVIFLLRRR